MKNLYLRRTKARAAAVSPVLAILLAVASPASAEPTPTERALAQTLFDEGRTLMADKRYAEACAKFVKSQELDPAAGTFINLALCHEAEGKLATAWAEFNEALSQALRDGRADREQAAREHIAELKPKLNQLTVVVPEPVKVRGLEIALDGVPLKDALWGIAMPIDPGAHQLVAKAPERKSWTTPITFDAPGVTRSVEIPPLEAEEARAATTSADGGPSRKTIAYAVGGVGVVALAVGTIFGIQAFAKNGDSEDECRSGVCTAKGLDLNDEARSAAWVSNVGVGLGLVGLGVGVYLFLTAPPEAKAALRPAPSPGGLRFVF